MSVAHKLRVQKLLGASVLLVTSLFLASCAEQETAAVDHGWAADIDAAKNRATSQFEKEVLSDGVVTRAEKEESMQRWISCMTDRGHTATVELDDNGNEVTVTTASIEGSAQVNADSTRCAEGTIKIIPGLYEAMQQNPENRDYDELYAECLVRHGVVEPPFSAKDFSDALKNSQSGQATPALNFDDPVLRRCLSAPDQ
ncbi:hypothetical protein ACLRGI_16610 [Paenarthrobacter nitroguajacolicus]|uniref:hypothetical protein n=1 Tax=Paenarthrobacter nitroguajacolicus TaxID=211146 RepID=UPI003ADFCB59